MKKKAVKITASFAVVLMVLSIIPSGAFALENRTGTDQADTKQVATANENKFGKTAPGSMRYEGAGSGGIRSMSFSPAENITEENFAEIQAEMLSSISEKIVKIQSVYDNVSEASTAEELRAVLLTKRQANIGAANPREKSGFRGEICGPCFFKAEGVAEENFSNVHAEVLNSLLNRTESLEEMQARLTEAGEEDRAEELDEKIAELQNLYAKVSEVSTAAELEEVIFSYLQTQTIAALEKKIELLNDRINENGNASDEKLTERITELTALIADIQGTESLADLKEIMSPEVKPGRALIQEGKGLIWQGGRGNAPERPSFREVALRPDSQTY